MYAVALGSSGRPRGEPERLTTGLECLSISLSGDGRRIAYAVYSGRSNIWSLPIPEGDPVTAEAATPLTSGNQVIESMRVSPDGRWLVYDSDLRGNADIYRIPVDGGEPEQLTSDPADEFAPDLSPDGRSLAYHSWRTGTRDLEIKPLDGGPIERVTATANQESFPRWSRDGRSILYYDQVLPCSVCVTHRDGGRWSPPVLVARGRSPEWSPDCRRIAYIALRSEVRFSPGPLMVVSAAGGDARQLFEPGATEPPADDCLWSPDGRTLFYKAHDAQGRASFWSVSAEGGAPRLLVRFEDPERQSARKDFAMDARRFYFAVEDRQSDVFVAEVLRK